MAVDIEELRSFCSFGPDRVYLLLTIARGKENPERRNSDRPVVREIVEDETELPRKIEQLDHAVRRFDEWFRLYISVNARDTLQATFVLRRRTDDWLEMRLHGDEGVRKKFKRLDSEFKSVRQLDTCRDETNVIFDVDDATAAEADRLQKRLTAMTAVRLRRETPNGYHIVTEPFNYNELETNVADERTTDNMLFLSSVGRETPLLADDPSGH